MNTLIVLAAGWAGTAAAFLALCKIASDADDRMEELADDFRSDADAAQYCRRHQVWRHTGLDLVD